MADQKNAPAWDYFIQRFESDPECVRTMNDIVDIEKVPEAQRFTCNSPNEALASATQCFPAQIALSYLPNGSVGDEPQRWTYSQYRAEVIAAANLFHSLGLQENQSVVLLLPNIPQFLFALWGAQAVGIAAPVNPHLQVEQLAQIVNEANGKILVTLNDGAQWLEKAIALQGGTSSIEHIIGIGGEPDTQSKIKNWQQEVDAQPSDRFIFERPLDGSETAAYFHTGGTTGTPKLAQHTHRAEILNVCQMNYFRPEMRQHSNPSHSVILCGLPLFHVNAVFVSALSAIVAGGELVLAGPSGFREKTLITDFWALVERYRVSFFAGVPTVYASLLEQPTEGYDLSSLDYCACGAAPMPVSLLKNFISRTGANVMEGYGMTETTVCASSHYYHGDRRIGSIGMRLPYQKIRAVILSANGEIIRECKTDEIGVILLSGPNVIPAYKQAFANDGAWPEPGWLNSGDMGRIDQEGYIWLTGRAKDLIIRGGHNIDPLITENSLAGHPEVELVAAVGKPDAYAGEVPVAYVQLRPDAQVTPLALKEFAREQAIERAGAPVEVVVVEAIPKTAVGKIFKPDLRLDAIARAYQEQAATDWVSGKIHAEVVEDKTHGLKVIMRTVDTQVDLAQVNDVISDSLDKFSYPWELRLPL